MKVELKAPTFEEKEVVRNLLELYKYELSPFTDLIEMDAFGRFGYRYLDHYWTDKDRFVYIILCNEKIAGFSMVRKLDYSGNQDYKWVLSEFFVLRKYQNRGIGRQAARQLFDRFAGPWIVGQLEFNLPSIAFWQKIISEYTEGKFVQTRLGDKPAQAFNSKAGHETLHSL